MAEDLIQNKRIPQLDPNSGIVPGMLLAAYNPLNDKTERLLVSAFTSSTNSQNFEWLTDVEYQIGDVVTWGGSWWQALAINENVTPGTNNTIWEEIPKSASGFVFWQAGVFSEDDVFVLYNLAGNIGIYYLANATRPFVSSDFEAELTAGDWVEVSAGQSKFKGVFASEAALDVAFPTAEPGDYAIVDTGGTEAALYIWDDTDTDWVASGVTTVVPAWDATTPGLVERSTTGESQNIVTRTAAGSSDSSNSDARTPSEKGLVEMLLQFLTSFKATTAEINTGTNTVKRITPDQLEGSKYLTQSGSKLSATAGGTNTYTATMAPALTAYVAGQRFFITFTNANTGASTLNLNGLGAKTILKSVSLALQAGDILAGQVHLVMYDGTNFQLLEQPNFEVKGWTFDPTTRKVTHTGLDSSATVQAEWLNNLLDSVMKIYNNQVVEFGGPTSVLSILSTTISGGAYIELNSNQAEAFKIVDKASGDYITFVTTTGAQALIFHQKIKHDTGVGFEEWNIQAFLRTSTVAGGVNKIAHIDIPTDQAVSVVVNDLFAYATDGSVVIADGGRHGVARNVAGTVSGAFASFTVIADPASTALWSMVADNTNKRVNINFINTTGAGKTFDVSLNYTYTLRILPV